MNLAEVLDTLKLELRLFSFLELDHEQVFLFVSSYCDELVAAHSEAGSEGPKLEMVVSKDTLYTLALCIEHKTIAALTLISVATIHCN